MSSATPAPTSHDDVQTARRRRAFFSRLRSRRGAALAALALTLVGATLPFPSLPAGAVHDIGVFELDGNAVDDVLVDGDDWDTVVGGTSAAAVSVFIEDAVATDDSYFTQGSKDIDDIPDWRHVDGSAPDKDEITNAYAATYIDGGQTYLYFGLDRFANNGDANAGFWLFQNPIGRNLDGTGTFSGEHEDGDIFIASKFTSGGQVPEITAYQWDSTPPPGENNLIEIMSSTLTCNGGGPDDMCAIANTAPVDAPWTYVPKSGPAGDFPTASFFEGGINLSAVFPGGVPCFSSFMAETRSSSSETATLKDFALGRFEFCGFTVQKTGDLRSKIGDAVNYSIVITNDGMAPLNFVSISDSLVDLADLVVPAECAVLDPEESCTINYSLTVPPGQTDDLVNEVTVVYEGADGADIEERDAHIVEIFEPSVTVEKTGDTLSTVGDPVDYTFVVTNTSSPDSPPLVNGTIVDTVLGNLLDPANPFVKDADSDCTTVLEVGASCTIKATRTVLAGDPDQLFNLVEVHYNPQSPDGNFPNDVTDSDDHTVNLFQPSVRVEKTGPALSKVGDTVEYNIKITNTSSNDTPTLLMDSIVDSIIPNLTIPAACQALAPGASCEFKASRVVLASDPDPLVNVVTVKFHADGFAVDVAGTSSTDNHSTDLFVPSVRVDKGGPATAQVGDAVTYTFKVTNTSSPGSPALILDSIADPLIGTLTIPASCNSLAVGASCNFTAVRTVLASDPDPLVNTATVHYHPLGFPNDIVDTDDHRIDIVTPSYGQDPDDDDLIPENPYDNSGGNGPTLGTDTAGNTDQTGTQVPAPATSDPVVQDNVVENPAGGQPDPAPVSLDQLPRTGQALDRIAAAGALLVILGGLILASRRRRPNQA